MKESTFLQGLKVEMDAVRALIEESKNPRIMHARKLIDTAVTRYYAAKKSVSDFRDTVVTTANPLQVAFLLLDTAQPIALSVSKKFLDIGVKTELIKDRAYQESIMEIGGIVTRADTFLRVLATQWYGKLHIDSLSQER